MVYSMSSSTSFHDGASMRLVVVLLEQLVTESDVLGLGVLLAQASIDLLLPLVVLGLALCCVSACLYSTVCVLRFGRVASVRAGFEGCRIVYRRETMGVCVNVQRG